MIKNTHPVSSSHPSREGIIAVLILFLLFTQFTRSQIIDLKLKENKNSELKHSLYKINPGKTKKANLPTPLLLLGIVMLINPMVVFEDKKVFFGLTKEVSAGFYPYGRLAFEYSYIFRDSNTSHLRFSYNYDILFNTAFVLPADISAGAGYFTDTKNKGWFLQASGGLIIPTSHVILNPYLRYRHTFIKTAGKSGIDDISLGAAFILLY